MNKQLRIEKNCEEHISKCILWFLTYTTDPTQEFKIIYLTKKKKKKKERKKIS